MCNLYTLAPWEVAHLVQHHRLIGFDVQEVMRGSNETMDVRPNHEAPVVVGRDGQRIVETMRWGFPQPRFAGSNAPVTNVRNAASGYWQPWLKREQRCLVPASAFAEPTATRASRSCSAGSSAPMGSHSCTPASGASG